MTLPPPNVVKGDLEALSAARRMAIGGIGLLVGGMLMLGAAYDLGGPIPATGVQHRLGITFAAVLAALSAVSFVGGLVAREELRRGTDGLAIVLVTLVTVPLAALAIGGWRHTHPPDKQVQGQPYTFRYPGHWKPNPHMDSVATQQNLGYVTALGARTTPDPGQGVLVVAFVPESQAALEDWIRKASPGVRVVNERTTRLAGDDALLVDYERRPGKAFQSQTAVMYGGMAYVVTCFLELESEEARAGCQKVLDTFRFR